MGHGHLDLLRRCHVDRDDIRALEVLHRRRVYLHHVAFLVPVALVDARLAAGKTDVELEVHPFPVRGDVQRKMGAFLRIADLQRNASKPAEINELGKGIVEACIIPKY